MTNYSLKVCETYIDKYINEYNGEALIINEGVLGLGTILLHGAKGKKNVLINEYFISAWTSGHSIRMYNKIPKKYKNLI